MSLGGSVLAPAHIDVTFLKDFRALLLKFIKKEMRFIIICGGGKTSREYMSAADKVIDLTDEDLDWLGIHATRLNAHLLRTILRDIAHPKVIRNPTEKTHFKEKVLIAAGWRPGWSTDHVAVLLSQAYGAKTVLNISNVDHVYDKDPSKHKDAQPLDNITWPDFRKMVGDEWSPGLNTPFDPVASKKGEQFKLKVIILSKDLQNLEKVLMDKPFEGTTIQ